MSSSCSSFGLYMHSLKLFTDIRVNGRRIARMILCQAACDGLSPIELSHHPEIFPNVIVTHYRVPVTSVRLIGKHSN